MTNTPRFRLRAVIKYYDTTYREYGTEEFTADFSPCTEEWQFASVQFSKSKYRTIQYIRVYCDYGYNSGTVYFDDVQLVRNSLETYLSASDFVVESTGTSDEAAAEAADTTPTFNEAKDKFGNALTETTFTDGDFGTIYRAFKFNADDDCMAGDDAGNNLVEETDARGQIRQIFYDAMGRITGYISPEGTVSYTYDANSNVLTVTDSHGTITRTYDALNRVTSYTDTYGKVIRYEYDAVGNLSKIIYPDNTAVTYAYDANHNLIRVTDWSNRVTAYTYDVNNRVTGVTKPDGSTTTTVYDNKQRVTSTVERTASGTVITGFEYTYDDLSRIIEEKVLANSTKMCYAYDSLSRVTTRTIRKVSDNSLISTTMQQVT